MGPGDKFCLQWNDFERNISEAFKELRDEKDFFDVTIACEEEEIQAHKLILAACSPFFRTLFHRFKHDHPLLYLKSVKYSDLVSILNFMYHGEVNIAQEDLSSFLAVAQDLKVKGLTQPPTSSTPTPGHKPHKRSNSGPRAVASANNNPETPNSKLSNKIHELKHELLESDDDDNANDEKENSYHENDSSSDLDTINTCKALQKYDNGESQLNLSGDLGLDLDSVTGAGEADTLLSQHIQRQSGGDRTDYVCLICQKVCKSRDECANHIEVHHMKIARQCPYCAMELTSRGGLRQHISRKHREEHRMAKGKLSFS